MCPGYTEPYPDGVKTLFKYPKGALVDIVCAQDCVDYISALTIDGCWINIWAYRNLNGDPSGVRFCLPIIRV